MDRLAGSIILLSGWKRSLVAMAAGAFAVLGQAPYDLVIAGFVSFPILVWLLDGATPAGTGFIARHQPAFATGWWFGFGYFLAGLWWIGGALLVESNTYAWALPFAVVGLPLYLSLYFGLAAALARALWSEGIGRIAAMAFAFAVGEWLREVALTGFPWNPLGFAAMPVPVLMQSIGIVGLMGMNALAVFVYAMPALLAGRRHKALGAFLVLLLIALHAGYGFYRMSQTGLPAGSLNVRIVQPNIDLSEKWDEAVRDRVFKTAIDLSLQTPAPGAEKPQLIVWPETSVPFLFSERPDALTAIGTMLGDGQLLLAGVVRTEGSGDAIRYYNAVVAIDDKGEIVDAVDKVHLVPFGEYLPYADLMARIGISQIVAGPMNFVAGNERHPIPVPGGFSALPYICYEVIFPYLMPQQPRDKDFILNVTNDAWFGDTPGPYQHLRQAQIRAAETGLPVIRSANTGISAAIDNRGRIQDALAMNSRGIVDAKLSFSSNEQTVHPSRTTIGFFVVLCLGFIALLPAIRQKTKN